MKHTLFSVLSFMLFSASINAQYNFTTEKKITCTPVKNQANTGTCWSFATASFLESELIRKGVNNIDLSEMYIVRNIYSDKANNYILRQGKANFSQGSLAHDLLKMAGTKGLITEEAYSGKLENEISHDHSELEKGLKGFLDGVRSNKRLSSKWPIAFEAIMDSYLGEVPDQFEHDGVEYTTSTFGEKMGLNMSDYISITSFMHHPFYDSFILEIPDNYSNGSYFNVPVDEMMSILDYAILDGYSVAWDGDVSEKGFSASNGIAVLPKDNTRDDLFSNPGKEINVTQENRQSNFMSYSTTDDHLMHIIGIAIDQKGTKYYIVKNSWGEISSYNGYLYMSEAYMRMKTVSITLHKDGLPKKSKTKLFDSE